MYCYRDFSGKELPRYPERKAGRLARGACSQTSVLLDIHWLSRLHSERLARPADLFPTGRIDDTVRVKWAATDLVQQYEIVGLGPRAWYTPPLLQLSPLAWLGWGNLITNHEFPLCIRSLAISQPRSSLTVSMTMYLKDGSS